jgi:hypothetical protein
VRVADGEPGDELQVDFGRMGHLDVDGRRRVVWALIFTACFSRHCFVWLSHRQTLGDVIDGFEAAWSFFGGVFRTVIPDNLKAIVIGRGSARAPVERGVRRVRPGPRVPCRPGPGPSPAGQAPRVERSVQFVRNSMWAGETFVDLADAQRHAEAWCRVRAGQRVHGTTQCPPVELFALDEATSAAAGTDGPLRPADLCDGEGASGSSHRGRQGALLGPRPPDRQRVEVRADRQLVRIYSHGQLVKTHPRQQPGRRSTDPNDLPDGTAAYALRDIDHLRRLAASHGPKRSATTRRRCWTSVAVDQDAPGLRPVGPREEVGSRTRQRGVRPGARGRRRQRRPDRPDARTWHREHPNPDSPAGHGRHRSVRSRPRPLRRRRAGGDR